MKQHIEIRNDGSVYLNDGRRETAAPSIGWLIELVHSRANNPTSELQRQLELVKTNLSAACQRISDLEERGTLATHEAHVALEARVAIVEREHSNSKTNFGQSVLTNGRLARLEDSFESVRVAFQSKR